MRFVIMIISINEYEWTKNVSGQLKTLSVPKEQIHQTSLQKTRISSPEDSNNEFEKKRMKQERY